MTKSRQMVTCVRFSFAVTHIRSSNALSACNHIRVPCFLHVIMEGLKGAAVNMHNTKVLHRSVDNRKRICKGAYRLL